MSGRVAIVTGAAGGIGSAVAERFARDGMRVVVTDIDEARAVAVAERLEGGAVAARLDVASREGWEELIARLRETHAALDVLVNNAGITRDAMLHKMTDDQWQQVIDVHLRGTWLGCQAALAWMRKAGGGRIVNISSIGAFGTIGQANYSAAKGGIISLTKTVAMEGARYGVLCNAIAPGSVDTPMFQAIPDDLKEQYRELVPLKRLAAPSEIAGVAAFLVSDDASYVTGEVIVADGGASIGG